jgi:hypothetical protein
MALILKKELYYTLNIVMNQIEAFMRLSTSPNAKTIITDGKGNVLNLVDDK